MSKRILNNDFFQIEYRTDALRINGITPTGKSNLLADLSKIPPISTPYGDFYFHGGHRLWHAPEAMPRTYIPDRNVNDHGTIQRHHPGCSYRTWHWHPQTDRSPS